MTDQRFNKLMHGVVDDIQKRTPRRLGNLQDKATYGRPVAHGKFVIVVDAQIAPYAPYVNNYKHHMYRDKNGELKEGKLNRNYRYFQKALVKVLEKLGEVEGEA